MSENKNTKTQLSRPVPFLPLGKVAEICNGKTDRHLAEGSVPVYGSGGIMRYVNKAANSGPAVLVPRKGSLANITYVDGPFWTVDTIFYTLAKDIIKPKFLYYYLLTQHIEDLNQAGGVPSLTQATLKRIRIPVPSLRVQEEIVRILDSFTSLEAELEAELESREQQYGYYLYSLFNFSVTVPRVALNSVAEVRSGWGFPKGYQGSKQGSLPFYKVSDMNLPSNKMVMKKSNNYISSENAHELGIHPAPAGTVLFPKIGAAIATNKKRLLECKAAYDNNVMGLIPNGDIILSEYLYYWMQTIDLFSLAHDSGAVPSIRKSDVEKMIIPLPDMLTQRRIIQTLNNFSSMITSLNIGLPAEIEARHKQYEYYRDRLLTFKELGHE